MEDVAEENGMRLCASGEDPGHIRIARGDPTREGATAFVDERGRLVYMPRIGNEARCYELLFSPLPEPRPGEPFDVDAHPVSQPWVDFRLLPHRPAHMLILHWQSNRVLRTRLPRRRAVRSGFFSGAVVYQLQTHSCRATCMAVSPSGARAAIGGEDGSVAVLSLGRQSYQMRFLTTCQPHQRVVTALCPVMLPCTGDVALEAQSGHSQWADRVQGPALGFVAEAWGLDDDEGEGVEDSGLASDRGYEFADGAVRAGRAGKQPLHPRARRWAPGYDPDRASVASSSSSSSSAAGVAAADLDFYPPSLSTTTVAESMARHGGAVPGFDWEGDSAAWPGTGQGGAEGSLRSVLAFASGSEDGRLLVWSPVTGRVLSSAVVEEERTTALCAFPLQPGGRVCVAAGSAAGTVQVVDVGAAPARLAAQAFPAYAPIVALEALPLPPSKDGSAAGVGILVSHPAGESAPDATLLDVAGEGGHSDRPLRLSTAWTAPRTMLIGRAGAAVVALPGGADAPHPLVVAAPSLDGSEVYCCRVPAPHAGGAAPSESPAFERIQLHARGPRGSQEEEEQQEEVQGAVERPAAGLLDEERDWRQEERGVSEGGGMTVPLSPHATVDRSPGPAQLAARVGSSPGPEEAGGARRLSSSQGAGSLEAQEERGARPHLEDRADWEEDEGVPRRGPPRPTPHPAGSYEAAPTGAGRERGSPARSPARVQVRAEGPGLAPCREPGPWRPPAVEGPPVPLDPAFRRPERAAALARWDGSAEGHGVPPTAPIAVPSDGVSSSAVAATMQQLEDEGFDEAAARQEAARRVEQRLTGPVPAPAGRARYAGLPPVDPVAPEAVAPRRAKRRVDRGWKQRQQRPPHPSDLIREERDAAVPMRVAAEPMLESVLEDSSVASSRDLVDDAWEALAL